MAKTCANCIYKDRKWGDNPCRTCMESGSDNHENWTGIDEKTEMKDVSDVLTVSFVSGLKDTSALCVSRKHGEKIIVLKMELGEQADILYYLLTEQMAKAELKRGDSPSLK